MPCQELVELVTDYIENALSARDRRRFESHLDECEWCVRYVEQMRRTLLTLGRLELDHLPPGAEDELRAAFRGWKAARG
jgi:anti-sigma factor RsiW